MCNAFLIAKVRISEQKTKENSFFLWSFERKYLLKTRFAHISVASAERGQRSKVLKS